MKGSPLRWLSFTLWLTAVLFAVLAGYVLDSYRLTQRQVLEGGRLKELAGIITYLDEVLTMSARMAAMTGDSQWEARYRRYEPQLKHAIRESIRLSPSTEQGAAPKRIRETNDRLAEMADQAFNDVRQNRMEEAKQLLSGLEYERNKQIYAQGMTRLTDSLSLQAESVLSGLRKRGLFCALLGCGIFLLLIVRWLFVLRVLKQWEKSLGKENRELSDQTGKIGELNSRLDQRFAQRTSELGRVNLELEKEIAERMKSQRDLEAKVRELEMLNRVMVGREERILDLKRRLKEFEEGRAA